MQDHHFQCSREKIAFCRVFRHDRHLIKNSYSGNSYTPLELLISGKALIGRGFCARAGIRGVLIVKIPTTHAVRKRNCFMQVLLFRVFLPWSPEPSVWSYRSVGSRPTILLTACLANGCQIAKVLIDPSGPRDFGSIVKVRCHYQPITAIL